MYFGWHFHYSPHQIDAFMVTRTRHGKARDATEGHGDHFAFSSDIVCDCGAYRGLAISTERDLVEYAIAFAYGETQRSKSREWLLAQKGNSHDSVEQVMAHATLSGAEQISRHRTQVIDVCAALFDNDVGRLTEIAEEMIRRASELRVLASVNRPAPTAVTFRSYALLRNVEDLCTYASILLLDESRPYRANVCRCSLETCSRYFLARTASKGRPRTRYHSEQCMLQAHDLGSAARARRSRAARAKRR